MIRVDMQATGENIKARCVKEGVTPEYISRYLNLDLSTPYYWFQGKVLPKIPIAFNLAEMLNCSLEDLFVVEDDEEGEFEDVEDGRTDEGNQ